MKIFLDTAYLAMVCFEAWTGIPPIQRHREEVTTEMAEETTKVERISLPAGDYMCQGDQVFLRGYVKPGQKYTHSYEYRMPIPAGDTVEELDTDTKRLYGDACSLDMIVKFGVLNFATKADNKAKLELGLIADQFDHEDDYSEAKHVAMQGTFESWRPGVRERKAVTTAEQADKLAEESPEDMIAALKRKGLLPDDFTLEV